MLLVLDHPRALFTHAAHTAQDVHHSLGLVGPHADVNGYQGTSSTGARAETYRYFFFLSIIDFHHLDIKISVFELNGN